MDKYFAVLDWVSSLYGPNGQKPESDKEFLALCREELEAQFDAGPEAGHIIRVWKQERGIQ